jgi:hypothetical protein
MRNKMKAKVCCLGLLFSIGFGSGLTATPQGEKNGEKPVQNALPSGKVVEVPSENATLVTSTPTGVAADSSVPKAQSATLLATVEILNIQKAFGYKNILEPFNLNSDVANFWMLMSLPLVGRDFSNLDEHSKVSILFSTEGSAVVIFKPTNGSKSILLNTFQEAQMLFAEQNGCLLLSLPKNNDLKSSPKDDDFLLTIQKNESLMKQAMTLTAKPEDPFKVECSVDIDAAIKAFQNDIAAAVLSNFKTFKVAVELNPDGIGCSITSSLQPTFPFYAQLDKANYTKPFPSLVFGESEVLSYSVSRNISWIFDMINFYCQKLYTAVGFVSGFGKQILDDVGSVCNDMKKCIAGGQFTGLFRHGSDLVLFDVGETLCKTVEEYVSCKDSLFDFEKKTRALSEDIKQAGVLAMLAIDN